MSKVTRRELGHPGHFICANDCRWRRHTQLLTDADGGYIISSVGELKYSKHAPEDGHDWETLSGMGYYPYETMVFRIDADSEPRPCGCIEPASWSEGDGQRWVTVDEAEAGHEAYAEQYRKILAKEGTS